MIGFFGRFFMDLAMQRIYPEESDLRLLNAAEKSRF